MHQAAMPPRDHRNKKQEEHLRLMRAQTEQVMTVLMQLLPVYRQAFLGAIDAGRDVGVGTAGHGCGGHAGRGRGGRGCAGRPDPPEEGHTSDDTSDEDGPPPPPHPAACGRKRKASGCLAAAVYDGSNGLLKMLKKVHDSRH